MPSKSIKAISASLLFSVFLALSALLPASLVSAAGETEHTWDGSAGDGKMSTAANWNTNEVPDTDDVVKFPAGVSETFIDADISDVMSQYVIGDLTGVVDNYVYQFTGNIRTKTLHAGKGGYVGIHTISLYSSSSPFSVLAADTDAVIDITNSLSLQSLTDLPIRGPGSVVVRPAVTVTGTVTNMNVLDAATLFYESTTTGFSPSVLGTTNGKIYAANAAVLGSNSSNFGENSVLYLRTNTTISKDLQLKNGSTISIDDYTIDGDPEAGPITLSGDIEFVSGTAIYDSKDYLNNLKLTGNLSGNGKIIPKAGTAGDVVVELEDGKTNTSGMPTGTTSPATSSVVITDSSLSSLEVKKNNIVIVNGQRGTTTVYDGGILKGTGTVGVLSVQSGGIVAPGLSPGCLNAGNTTIAGTYETELSGITACSEYDQLRVSGTVDVTGGALSAKLLNDYKPVAGDTFTILSNDGSDAITGTFTDLAEGATFTIDGVVFKISYVGGDGNDVVLTVQSVPSTPNTGMQLLTANPLLTLTLTTLSAGTLFVLGKRYALASKRK